MRNSIAIRLAILTLLTFTPLHALASGPPDVRFVVVRLDWRTHALKSHAEFRQPYRTAEAPRGFESAGRLWWHYAPPHDFGGIQLVSALTGRKVLQAGTVWDGTGSFEFPLPGDFSQDFDTGHLAHPPDTVVFLKRFGGAQAAADSVVRQVEASDVLEDLAEEGRYELVVLDHFYRVGFGYPATAEWFVVAYSVPENRVGENGQGR